MTNHALNKSLHKSNCFQLNDLYELVLKYCQKTTVPNDNYLE